jgi:hypothetical protein
MAGWIDGRERDALDRRTASIGWIEADACDWIEGAAAVSSCCLQRLAEHRLL